MATKNRSGVRTANSSTVSMHSTCMKTLTPTLQTHLEASGFWKLPTRGRAGCVLRAFGVGEFFRGPTYQYEEEAVTPMMSRTKRVLSPNAAYGRTG
jgi:hypothetical protein